MCDVSDKEVYTLEWLRECEVLRFENVSEPFKSHVRTYDLVIPPIGTVIIVTNIIVVISSGLIIKSGQQPVCTYLFMGNVAMADVLTGLFVVMGVLYPKALITDDMCAIHLGFIVASTITSNFSVTLVAIDRFLYILHGIKYKLFMYSSRAKLMIKFSWILGCVFGFLPFMGWKNTLKSPILCWYVLIAPKNNILLTAICAIFLPLIIVITLYTAIMIKAVKKSLQLRRVNKRMTRNKTKDVVIMVDETIPDPSGIKKHDVQTSKTKIKLIESNIQLHSNVKNPPKWRAIRVVMLTTGSFTCTWLPYFIACVIYTQCDPVKHPRDCFKLEYAIASPLAILGFLNSLLNPLIYAWWHNGFRTSFLRMRKKKPARQNQVFVIHNKNYEPS